MEVDIDYSQFWGALSNGLTRPAGYSRASYESEWVVLENGQIEMLLDERRL